MTAAIKIVSVTADELAAIVEAAVRKALGASSEWLGPDEVAMLLGVARSSLKVLVSREALPAHRSGRSWRFKRAEVETWLLARAERPRGHASRHGATLRAVRGGK